MHPEIFAMPVIQMLLIAIVFLAILVEIKTAGAGVGALLGLIAAAIFFGSQYMTGLISYLEIALFLGGVLFIVIEVLTPGTGIFAGLGVLAILYSFVLSLGGDWAAVYSLLISLAIAVVAFLFIARYLTTSAIWKKFVLKNAATTAGGFVSSSDFSALLHQEGVVATQLRPAGTAEIGRRRYDVVSEGGFIAKGVRIQVISVNGSVIVVRPVEQNQGKEASID